MITIERNNRDDNGINVYMIAYDLHEADSTEYRIFDGIIKEIDKRACKPCYSTWLVRTRRSEQNILNSIKRRLEDEDLEGVGADLLLNIVIAKIVGVPAAELSQTEGDEDLSGITNFENFFNRLT